MKPNNFNSRASHCSTNQLSTPKTICKRVGASYTDVKQFNAEEKGLNSRRQTCQSLSKRSSEIMKSYHLKNNIVSIKDRTLLYVQKQKTLQQLKPFNKTEAFKQNIKIDLKLFWKQNGKYMHCQQNVESIIFKAQRKRSNTKMNKQCSATSRQNVKGSQIQDIILSEIYFLSKNKQQLPKSKIIKLKLY